MKVRGFLIVATFLGMIYACQTDLEPTLIVTVVDSTDAKLEGARVFTDPCRDKNSPCDHDRVNPAFIQEGLTNSAGQATFEYPYSAIIDVFAQYVAPDCDTSGGDTTSVWCLQSGRSVARFETKKVDAGEKNEYFVKVVVVPEI